MADKTLGIHVDGIEREPHAHAVNPVRADEHALALREVGISKKPPATTKERVGDGGTLGQHNTSRTIRRAYDPQVLLLARRLSVQAVHYVCGTPLAATPPSNAIARCSTLRPGTKLSDYRSSVKMVAATRAPSPAPATTCREV